MLHSCCCQRPNPARAELQHAVAGKWLQGMAVWAFNGIGLALLIPNAQSLVADYFSALSRGKAFGALWLTGALGGMLGALYATNMGKRQ